MQRLESALRWFLTGLCAAVPPCLAQDSGPLLAEREQLLELLATQTELATRTRLNADYVPGVMTVLHGERLEARGARTVWDALGFVPGVKPVTDHMGHRRLVVRGIGAPGVSYQSGNLKLLLNGVAMNTSDKGLADSLYYIPVEQVDRIEVIRGPGSAVHGEYALSGVINVITHRERDRAYAFGGGFDTAGGGISLHGRPEGGPRIDLSLSAWNSDGADVRVARDGQSELGQPALSHAPGKANEGIAARNGVLNLEYRNLSLSAQWSESRLGDYFGINQYLPPASDREVERSRTRTLEAGYRIPFAGGELKLLAGSLNYLLRKDDLYAAPGLWVDTDYEERKHYTGAELTLQRRRHTWFAAAYQDRTRVHQAYQAVSGLPPLPHPLSNHERDSGSFVLQDEFRAGDHFTLTTGLRYDHFSGVGNSLSPRIAGVWRISEQRVLKGQYGRAFRPPTFSEAVFASPDLEPVIVDTVEVAYIAKSHAGEWRATLFYSALDDLIVFNPDNVPEYYANTGSAKSRGIELEARRRVAKRLELEGSVSYASTRLSETATEVPGSSNWLARIGVGYRLNAHIRTALEYRHVGPTHRQPDDPRGEMAAFDTVDATVSVGNARHWMLRAGVSNLFDHDVRDPAFLSDNPPLAYRDDLPRGGRTWWLQASRDL